MIEEQKNINICPARVKLLPWSQTKCNKSATAVIKALEEAFENKYRKFSLSATDGWYKITVVHPRLCRKKRQKNRLPADRSDIARAECPYQTQDFEDFLQNHKSEEKRDKAGESRERFERSVNNSARRREHCELEHPRISLH